MKKLTDKQELFCQEYLIDLNATKAALRAGYSPETSRSQGQRMLTNVDIQARISVLKSIRSKRLEISQDYVINTIVDTIERCKQAEPVMQKIDGVYVNTGEYKFDASAVLKGAELLGKHLAMWTDKTKIEGELKGSIDPENWLRLQEKVSPDRAKELLENFANGKFD